MYVAEILIPVCLQCGFPLHIKDNPSANSIFFRWFIFLSLQHHHTPLVMTAAYANKAYDPTRMYAHQNGYPLQSRWLLLYAYVIYRWCGVAFTKSQQTASNRTKSLCALPLLCVLPSRMGTVDCVVHYYSHHYPDHHLCCFVCYFYYAIIWLCRSEQQLLRYPTIKT